MRSADNGQQPEPTPPVPDARELESWLVSRVAARLGRPDRAVEPDAVLADLGLSSRDLLVLLGELQERIGRAVPPSLLWEQPTARRLSRRLVADGNEVPAPLDQRAGGPSDAVAIIGMGCRFPGADSPDAFWDLLERGGGLEVANPPPGHPALRRPHGLLADVDRFDAELFAISGREAAYVDPQQRLLLEVAWEVLEHAAVAPASLAGTRTGVFIGISGSDYGRLQAADPRLHSEYSATGQALSIAANRISYVFDLKGPSIAVDTACSSSLVALHLASRSLRTGESTLAIAGGVNLVLSEDATDIFSQAGMMAPDGRCKTFDSSADGYVRSEGCGLVLLKPLAAALRDGDQVIAVIRGSAVNQDGRSNGLTAPHAGSQRAVIIEALRDASVEPSDIDYVEAHGTGTPLGDPIEAEALASVLSEGRPDTEPFLLGSVKTNIGHAEAAAGIAGILKVALMLRHRRIPPHLHLHTPNPRLPDDPPFTIPVTVTEWRQRRGPLTAGVSSFGFGGANAHVVVQAAPTAPGPATGADARPSEVLTLSARTEPALQALASRYQSHLRAHPELPLADLANTLHTGRSHLRHRAAFVAAGRDQALPRLGRLAAGEPDHGLYVAATSSAGPGKVAFLFSGQGSQYLHMGRQLFVTNARFRDVLMECSAPLPDLLGRSLPSIMFPRPAEADLLDQTRFTQPVLFCLEYALARLWQSWGLNPDYLLGHSVGELAAACVAGVFDVADGLRLVAERGRLVEELSEPGEMLAVFADEALVRDAIAAHPGAHRLAVAAVNAATNVTVAGEPAGIQALRRALSERGVQVRPLRSRFAFHSPMMAAARQELARVAGGIAHRPPRIPLVSDLAGRLFDDGCGPDAEYWGRQLVETVRYADAVRFLAGQGCTTFVEVGPQQVLIGAGRREVTGATWLPSLREGVGDWDVLNDSLARLYVAGHDIDWRGVAGPAPGRRLHLPTYPFERERHWLPAAAGSGPATPAPKPAATADPTPAAQPDPPPGGPPTAEPAVADPVLAVLGDVIARALEYRGAIDPDLSFLELGADSMTLFQTIQTVQKTFQVSIPVGRLFEEINTLRRLAGYIREVAPAETLAAFEAGGTAPEPAPEYPEVAGPTGAGIPLAADGGSSELARFLDVHARVMTQAYQLLIGQPGGPAADRGSADRGNGAHRRTAALSMRDTFVAFGGTASESRRLTEPQREYMAELVRAFCDRTRRSKEQAIAERTRHADVRHAPQPYLNLSETRYPIVVTRSRGPRVWDLDGNEYLDVTMGFGVNLFGHNEAFLNDAVTTQLAEGMQLGPHTPLVAEVADLICELTDKQRAVFCNTGSEAVMVAVRLARAVTGRDKIALFAGSYHGSADPILVRQDLDGDSVPMAPGVPQDVSRNALVLPYGDEASLAVLREHGDQLAAVLVEPVQSRRPDLQPVEFLRQLRQLTHEAGIALIFDEVITGFRMHPRGAQGLFGVTADLTTYGKVVGGGLPIGVVAGDPRYLDAIDGGAWQFGDRTPRHSVRTFFSGTFCKHPLAMAAARAVLQELRRRGPALQEELNRRTEALAGTLNTRFEAADVPIRVVHFGSLFRLRLLNEPLQSETVELFHTKLVHNGLYIWEGRNCFLSTAHTDQDVQEITATIAGTVDELIDAGFFPGARGLAGAEPDGLPDGLPGALASAEPAGDRYPLTRAQHDLWFLAQIGPNHSRAYHESVLLDLQGPVDPAVLRDTVEAVLDRHDSLRTVFAEDGTHQRVRPPGGVDVPVVDFSELFGTAPADRVAAWFDERAEDLLDLAEGPVMTAVILRRSPEHHQVYLAGHHAVLDGWSFRLLLEEILTAYQRHRAGEPAGLPPAPRYREYVEREQRAAATPPQQAAREYWLAEFPDGLPVLRLPADHPRPAKPARRGGRIELRLEPEVAALVGESGRRLGVTAFTTLLGAYGCLLHRLTGQPEVVVGVPVAQRDYPGADRLVGHCSEVRPIRSRHSPQSTVREYLLALHRTLLGAYQHAGVPFAELQRRQPTQGAQAFGSFFNLDRTQPLPQPDGVRADVIRTTSRFSKADLEVDVMAIGPELTITCDYDAEIFEERTVRGHLQAYQALLRELLSRPDERLAALAAPGSPGLPETTLAALVEAQVARTPEAPAVYFEGQQLTYAALNEQANRLARHLRGLGVGPEHVVAVAVPRSCELVVAVLAVVKAGAAFLPVDPDHPPARTEQILADARPTAVLAVAAVAGSLPPAAPVLVLDEAQVRAAVERHAGTDLTRADFTGAERPAPLASVAPANAAYVLYTSGSTGRPKGVVVPHAGIVNTLRWWQGAHPMSAADRTLLKTPLTFDPSIHELFWPLAVGALLVVARPDGHQEPRYLVELVTQAGVTSIQFVPATLREFLREPDAAQCHSLRHVLCGGEELPGELVERFYDLFHIPLVNLYGPTEASIEATSWPCRRGIGTPVAPIGSPIWNVRVYVLDADLHQVPVEAVGELYIAGAGLARGYLHRPELTAERFVPDPFAGSGDRMYRTGDLVRRSAAGELEFAGRTDSQVKVNGVRVELGEVAAALRTVPGVTDAAVLAHRAGHQPTLVGYLARGQAADPLPVPELVRHLRIRLPAAMLPSRYVEVVELPSLPNGKTDLQALRALPVPDPPAAASDAAPRTAAEKQLLAIWSDVLGRPEMGVDDDFFALGGTSLAATQVLSRIRVAMGVEVPVRTLFASGTVAELARELAAGQALPAPLRPPLVAAPRPPRVPLSYGQEALWFLHKFEGASATYNIPFSLRLTGQLDRAALRQAFADLVARHESLRTTVLPVRGVATQRIVPAGEATVAFESSTVSPDGAAAAVAAAAAYRFDLVRELPLRAWLFEVAPPAGDEPEHVLTVVMHHIATDAWSMKPLAEDLAHAYAARTASRAPDWSPLPVQYPDYALWQRVLLGSETDPESRLSRQVAYWRSALDGVPDELPLPFDRPRPPKSGHRGATVPFRVGAEVQQAMAALAGQTRASQFMVAQAALALLLTHLGAGTDIPLGSPVAGRTDEALDALVGFFVNTLVLRTDTSGDPTFRALVERVRDANLGAYANQDVPFEHLVRALNPPRRSSRHPLFQVMLVAEDLDAVDLTLDGVRWREEPVTTGTAKFDLLVNLREGSGRDGAPGGIDGTLEYSRELFDEATARRLAAGLERLLAAVTRNPDVRGSEVALEIGDQG